MCIRDSTLETYCCRSRTQVSRATTGDPAKPPLHACAVGVDGEWCGRWRNRRRFGFAIDQFLQLFTGLEVGNLLRRNVHLVPRLRIAPLERFAPAQPQAPEATQLDLLPPVQGIDDALED